MRAVVVIAYLAGCYYEQASPLPDDFGACTAAKQTVLERTRRRLMHDLRLAGAEVDSLIRLVQRRIDLPPDALATK